VRTVALQTIKKKLVWARTESTCNQLVCPACTYVKGVDGEAFQSERMRA
jgi:hypothetical protein